MKHALRSATSTEGRRMSGARALWIANGMKREMMGKPIVAIANSFTQFVPGHTHLHEIGQIVKREIEALGCYAAEFNTIAIDDGIAMAPPRYSFLSFITQKVVAVPKSNIISGAPYCSIAATALTIRSAPISFGLS